jgi:tetratricopeptide (TPR) repeat protein
MALAEGSVLDGRYRVLRQLGEGGMGSVYQVEDLARPSAVWALKVLLDDTTASPEDTAWARRRFDDEIALMRTLAHPRIPRFCEALVEGGRRCFVMEFIPGVTLEERLAATHAPLPERDVLRWLIAVCDVLTYLHGRQPPIIVRDLKPGNIMITPAGDVRLIDFGIARTFKPGKIGNTENLGTMTYASPEHLGQAQTDARSDIYSLGATMFHLLTNTEPVPMETPTLGLLRRLAPRVSLATEEVATRAMQLDPQRRFQSAAELRDALARCLARLETSRADGARPAPARAAPTRAARATVATLPIPVEIGASSPTGGAVCPRCGFVNRRNARFCAQDGISLRGTAGSPLAAPVARASAELSAQRATEALAAGRFQQAVRQCDAALAQGRPTAELQVVLGRAQQALGRHREAASAFAEAAHLRPAAATLALEGAEWRAAGEPARALVALTRARQLDPHDPAFSLQLGEVCLELGHLAQAEGELRDVLAARPDDPAALLALGRVFAARRDWQQAIETYRAALTVADDNAALHLGLGQALLAVRKTPEATRELERAARLDPVSAAAYKALGLAYHASGQRARARAALRRAAELDPHDVETQRLLKDI